MSAPDANEIADAIESMLPTLREPHEPGYERRAMCITVEDIDGDLGDNHGGEIYQSIELDLGETELIIAALRAYRPFDIGGN